MGTFLGILMILAPLVALLLWGIYNGDVYPREAGIFVTIFLLLQIVLLLLKLAVGWSIATYFLAIIYLVVKIYGGDVKIR